MASALEELASLERLTQTDTSPKGRPSARFAESQKVARAKAAMAIESLVEDLGDRASAMTVLKMVEATGIGLDRALKESSRRGDLDTANLLKKFMERVSEAVKMAAAETLQELRR